MPRLRGIVEHIGDLGIEVHENDVLKESVQTDENDTADNNADDDLDCGIDIAFAGLGREGGLGTNGKLGCLGIDLVNEFLHVKIPLSFVKCFCLGLRGVVEHIGDLGIEVHKNDILKESVQTDENDATDYDADDDLDCGIDIAFAGLGCEGGFGTNGKLGCLGIDLVDKLFHLMFPFMFEIIWFTVNGYLPKQNRLHFSRVLP